MGLVVRNVAIPQGRLEEVIILPIGNYTSGSYVMNNYSWSDFESVEIITGISDADPERFTSAVINKETISANPTDFALYAYSAGTDYGGIRATGTNSFDVIRGNNDFVRMVKGYVRTFGTENVSAIINVNDGNAIGIDERYEIDVAASLGSDYVGKDLIVEAEIFNNSGQGVADWGNPEWVFINTVGVFGVRANVIGDKIVVQTAINGLSRESNRTGDPFDGVTNITSTTCRVKVWKVDQLLPTSTGSTSKVELWSGNAGNGNTITLSQAISNFDILHVEGLHGSAQVLSSQQYDTGTYAESAVGKQFSVAPWVSTSYLRFEKVSDTEIEVVETGDSNAITKVIGIKY